jgi:hypothetical protein
MKAKSSQKTIALRWTLVILLLLFAAPAMVLADAPTPVGDLDLEAYCIAQGYAGVTLTQPRFGPNAAFNNWRCVTAAGRTHPFSMEQACKWQYDLNPVQTHPTDPDDAWTWVCYGL